MNRKEFLKGAAGTMAMAAMAGISTGFAESESGVGQMSMLDILAAKDAIREQYSKYCIAVDLLDRQMGYNFFTEDSDTDYISFKGTGKEFIDWGIAMHEQYFPMTCHRMVNHLITIDSPTEAHGQVYGHINMISPTEEEGVYTLKSSDVRYFDKWVKEADGQWRVKKRNISSDWGSNQTVKITGEVMAERSKKALFYEYFTEYK